MGFVLFLTACPTLYFLYKWAKQKDEELYERSRVKVPVKDKELH